MDEVQSEYLETTSGAVDVILPDESVAELGERRVAGGLGYRFVKRAFDIAFSALVIAVLVIPVAILCLVIVLDSPGAPFFRQERIGKGRQAHPHMEAAHHGGGRP